MPVPTDTQPDISPKCRAALQSLCDGTCRTVTAAAERHGLSRVHLSRVLHSPTGRAFAEREMRKNVQHAALRASHRLHELVDSPSQTVSFDATRLSLAISGIKPDETSRVAVSVDIRAGYILDLRSGNIEQSQGLINTETVSQTPELPNNHGQEATDTKQQQFQGLMDFGHSDREATAPGGHSRRGAKRKANPRPPFDV